MILQAVKHTSSPGEKLRCLGYVRQGFRFDDPGKQQNQFKIQTRRATCIAVAAVGAVAALGRHVAVGSATVSVRLCAERNVAFDLVWFAGSCFQPVQGCAVCCCCQDTHGTCLCQTLDAMPAKSAAASCSSPGPSSCSCDICQASCVTGTMARAPTTVSA